VVLTMTMVSMHCSDQCTPEEGDCCNGEQEQLHAQVCGVDLWKQ
jgi:hypothetical protein